MTNIGTYLAYFFVVCFGVALGAFVQSKLDRKPAPRQPSEDSLPAPDGSLEVLRIWRATNGQLQLGMDMQQLANAEALTPDQRRRLVKLVIDLRPWLDTAALPEGAPVRPAAPAPTLPPAPSPAAAKPPSEVKPVPGPLMSIVGQINDALQPKPAAEAKPAPKPIKTIVEQINDVLQAKLDKSPYKGQDIVLADGPMGEVIVKIGLYKYNGIDAVPDAEIKAMIRQAVSDWEKGSK
jgi:hypothetical protein